MSTHYDVALLDLDGVVYVGPDAVSGAPDHLAAAQEAGMRLAYVTNNASRPPARVADHLRDLGIAADDEDVVTSAQAAARLLAEDLDPGAPVYVIGGAGLLEALEEEGLRPVDADERPVAVVSGFHPDLAWRTVITGAILVKRGLPWVASNTDATVPTPLGPGPGNGVLVKVVSDFAEVSPRVAGKPEPPLFAEALRRMGGERALVVGDRLDTDIEGAVRSELDSLLVMTGVTAVAGLVAATAQERPTYVGATLGALQRAHQAVRRSDDGEWRHQGWRGRVREGRLEVEGDGGPDEWWQLVAAIGWEHLDRTGDPVQVDHLDPPDAR